MIENAFQHWHIHYDGSKFDGMCTISEVAEDIKQYEKPAYAVTDHGTMISCLSLHSLCKKIGIKFVPGSEMYVVNKKDEKLDGPKKRKYDKKRHIVLLAMNQKGFENLIYLSSLASMYFFNKPRIEHKDIWDHSEGIIVLTACLGGLVCSPLLWDDASSQQERSDNAYKISCQYREVFGDRFYLEIQPVEKEEQLIANNFMCELHEKFGFNIIATNDVHYAKPEQFEMHARLIAVQNRSNETELVYKPGHHLRNLEEMRSAFIANGIAKSHPFHVEHALMTANTLDQRMSGVLIDRKTKVPEYKE